MSIKCIIVKKLNKTIKITIVRVGFRRKKRSAMVSASRSVSTSLSPLAVQPQAAHSLPDVTDHEHHSGGQAQGAHGSIHFL